MKIKKGDVITIVGLLALSLFMSLLISQLSTRQSGQYLRIEKDSKLYKEVPLNKDTEILLDGDGQYNKVVIKNGKAYMDEANCRDQICVHMRPISIDGETIICLPNKVFLEVVDKNKDASSDGIDKINR